MVTTRRQSPVIASQLRVKGDGVGGQHSPLVAPVRRRTGGVITPHERSDRPEPSLAQHGEQAVPGVGAVGEPVQAEGERPVVGPGLEYREVDPVGFDASLGDLHGRGP